MTKNIIEKEKLDKILELYNAEDIFVSESGDILIIVRLAFHVAVYLNPDEFYNSEDRYCYLNSELAKKAITEYFSDGVLRYWQKHHNKSISINGNLAYRSGEYQIPSNSLYSVEWNIDELSKKYIFN